MARTPSSTLRARDRQSGHARHVWGLVWEISRVGSSIGIVAPLVAAAVSRRRVRMVGSRTAPVCCRSSLSETARFKTSEHRVDANFFGMFGSIFFIEQFFQKAVQPLHADQVWAWRHPSLGRREIPSRAQAILSDSVGGSA